MDEKSTSNISNEVNQVYTVPMEINSELKLKGTIPVTLIVAAFGMFFLAQRFSWMIFEPLRVPWYIYNVVVAIIMSIKGIKNGEKRLFQSILLYLSRDTNSYAPIKNPADYYEMEVPTKDED